MSPRDKFALIVGVIMFTGLGSISLAFIPWWPIWATQALLVLMVGAPLAMAFSDDYIEKKDEEYYQTHPRPPSKPYKSSKWDGLFAGLFLVVAGSGLLMSMFEIIPDMLSQLSTSGGLSPAQISGISAILNGHDWRFAQFGFGVMGVVLVFSGSIITASGLNYGIHELRASKRAAPF